MVGERERERERRGVHGWVGGWVGGGGGGKGGEWGRVDLNIGKIIIQQNTGLYLHKLKKKIQYT